MCLKLIACSILFPPSLLARKRVTQTVVGFLKLSRFIFMDIITRTEEEVINTYTSLGFSEQRLTNAQKAPITDVPTSGIFADIISKKFTTDKGEEVIFPALVVVDEKGRTKGDIPVSSILRQVCTGEAFKIKATSDSPNKGKWGLKSERLNKDFIYGSETSVVASLLGQKFTVEIVKDVKSPIVLKGGLHFKGTEKEALKMFEVKPQSPRFLTLG